MQYHCLWSCQRDLLEQPIYKYAVLPLNIGYAANDEVMITNDLFLINFSSWL